MTLPKELVQASVTVAAPEDGALVERLRLHDPEALAILYWRYAPALLRTAFAITGSGDDAQDIVQDVFVGLGNAMPEYEDKGQLLSWLKRIAARRALTHLRSRNRFTRLTAEHDRQQSPGSTTRAIAIRDAFAALPDNERVVVGLKEIEGYSHGDIAELLGIRRGTSEVRLHRALKRLKLALEGL